MGAWQKTMKPQKPGNSPGPESDVIKKQRVAKEQVTQRVCSWTVQNEMRGVLGECFQALQEGFSTLLTLER